MSEYEEVISSESEEGQENWKDKYLRTLAEMENMRKRMQKERQETTRFGVENAIGEFLPAIDNLENALRFAENAGGEVKVWALGFEMILSQFKETLHNHGVVSFHSEGNLFDPLYHEAVETVETEDHPDGMILHEFSKGYKSGARTVRPARVKVAKHPQKSPSLEEDGIEANHS
ncbi:MAG TPA: nucleotide exchange factor GrpE [Chlamydiales bacterium]|nr:MAG: nucleotide exchange factor GrpE [Verrucomicrobia bacterium RIFCSPHIGHO2_12_FULL_41_10]HLB52965.1 nucleotide exchange factor GrpE [Chlamydiales bacterium]